MTDDERLQKLQIGLEYLFHDPALLRRALTHPSHHHIGSQGHNEPLATLGDAVLALVVTGSLFAQDRNAAKGTLTEERKSRVRNDHLTKVAHQLDLENHLRLGRGESKNLSGEDRRLATALEAVIGAMYLDGGFEAARRFVERVIVPA